MILTCTKIAEYGTHFKSSVLCWYTTNNPFVSHEITLCFNLNLGKNSMHNPT